MGGFHYVKAEKQQASEQSLTSIGFCWLVFLDGKRRVTSEALANTPPPSQGNELLLGEEELSDVSLATFYVFDKENTGAPPLADQLRLARGGCGGCGHGCGGGGHGCGCGGGGCRCGGGVHVGCGGCHVACRGCRCGGRFFFGCVGCVGCGGCGTCWTWLPGVGWTYSCWGESTPSPKVSDVASELSAQTAEVAKGDGNIIPTRTK
jgi:hypothetical protein